MELPVVGITMGDPAGVGPEVIVKALSDPGIFKVCKPVVLGEQGIISKAVNILESKVRVYATIDIRAAKYEEGRINVVNLSSLGANTLVFGRGNEGFAEAIINYVKTGARLACNGEIEAITTAPINKEVINKAGYKFSGHTELLAELTKTKDYVMMLAGKRLKVALATTHCSLKDVAGLLDIERIYKTIDVTDRSLKEYFALSRPKLAVASLNPHAGEGGLFGDEEERIIVPAINRAKKAGIDAIGPLSADSLFYYASRGDYDVVICMYHDQGLIPLKLLSFQDAVNVTLGLPIIRTSVDHGTAYDIAGKGEANEASLKNAIQLAASMAAKKMKTQRDL